MLKIRFEYHRVIMGKDTSGRQVLKAFQSSGKNTESLLNELGTTISKALGE
jgi:hypothetical protein